jgi:indole-3-glycerol phosphate synthase
MADILQTIAASTKLRVERAKNENKNVREIALAEKKNNPFFLEEKIKGDGVSFICEVKKASPSKGIIAEDFPYEKIGVEYEAAGADAISVLTEPEFFKGKNDYLTSIKSKVSIPVLRKDFTIDEYQIYEAKNIGADAVLLICALLDTDTLEKFIKISDSLCLSAIVEAHNEDEVKSALRAGARIIGVNNRNLKDFTVDVSNSLKLRKLVPKDVLFISESGIKTREDIERLEEADVNAALIGETFMRSSNKSEMLKMLKGLN